MSLCSIQTQETVNAEWNAMAGDWDDLASGYRDSFQTVLWEDTGLLCTIVDFGCGTGLLTESLVASCPKAKIICIDAAQDMISQVEEKIQARQGWRNNVEAHGTILGRMDRLDMEEPRKIVESLKGQVDLIVASSVMSFIPKSDLTKTMEELGKLLRPNGIFCHSDWPQSDQDPCGFSKESTCDLYEKGHLKMKSHCLKTISMGSNDASIFVGVAYLPHYVRSHIN
jgi:SAM-dependent methyltransferase